MARMKNITIDGIIIYKLEKIVDTIRQEEYIDGFDDNEDFIENN